MRGSRCFEDRLGVRHDILEPCLCAIDNRSKLPARERLSSAHAEPVPFRDRNRGRPYEGDVATSPMPLRFIVETALKFPKRNLEFSTAAQCQI
jgi:hypothetical protein